MARERRETSDPPTSTDPPTNEHLTAAAIAILRKNDRGDFTVPTARLYPHQWNWDSAFVALAWAKINERRAWRELEALLGAQWPGGMVPHIVYHTPSDDYFPTVERWGETPRGNSSGLTQNPVAASCARELWQQASERAYATERARRLVPQLNAWHQWFYLHRRDRATGLIAIAHPWESRDNACDWDAPLAAMKLDAIPSYTRKDLTHADAAQRPTPLHYRQFLTIIEAGKRVGWRLTRENAPFWVADPFLMSILIAAERDLAQLARQVDRPEIARAADTRRSELADSLNALWDPHSAVYRAYDLLAERASEGVDIGTFMPLYAGTIDQARARQLLAHLERWLQKTRYGVPSHDPTARTFEAQRYWRGPIWLVVNKLIAAGATRYGRDDLARRIANDSRTLIQTSGFREAFNPLTGQGSGGDNFSWTAAIWLTWLQPL